MDRRVLIIGGAGFIGSNLVRIWNEEFEYDQILVADNFAPGVDPKNLLGLDGRYTHARVDLRDEAMVRKMIEVFQPHVVINCGTSFHYEEFPQISRDFYETDVLGTLNLLESCRAIWGKSKSNRMARFVQVSSDEVFGTLAEESRPFEDDDTPVPATAYGTAKNAADQLAIAHHAYYGMDVVVTIGPNTFGPNQRQDYLIPYVVENAFKGKPIRIPDASTSRDWIYVEDHCWGIMQCFELARPGLRYCLSGNTERTNGEVAEMTCAIFERLMGKLTSGDVAPTLPDLQLCDELPPNRRVIRTVGARAEWGWGPEFPFDVALENTVLWYLNRLLGKAAAC